MRERPLTLAAPPVRAALLGHKTQLRVPILPVGADPAVVLVHELDVGWWPFRTDDGVSPVRANGRRTRLLCPLGVAGDRLWVREKFSKIYAQRTKRWIETDHEATYKRGDRLGDFVGLEKEWSHAKDMPREAARLVLELTAVRAEPLRAVSEAEAQQEGAPRDLSPAGALGWFRATWDHEHGEGAWTANPWVWVVEFHKVAAAA